MCVMAFELYKYAFLLCFVVCVAFAHTCVGVMIITYVSFISFWRFFSESVICLMIFELWHCASFVCSAFGVGLMRTCVNAIIFVLVNRIRCLYVMFRDRSCIR